MFNCRIKERKLPSSEEVRRTELDIFDANLDKIMVTKARWDLEYRESDVNKRLRGYREFIDPQKRN